MLRAKPRSRPRASAWPWCRRILVIGKTPLGEQVVREIANRPAYGEGIGVLDERLSGAPAGDKSVSTRDVARLDAVIDKLSPDHIVVALTDRRNRTPLMQALLT